MVTTKTTVLVVLAALVILAGAPTASATENVIEEKPSCVTFSVNPPGAWIDPGCIPEGTVPPPPTP